VFFGTDVVGLSTGGSERVRVDASGNVGIGTSAPVRPLVIRTGASVSSVIKLANADSGETLTDGLDLAFDGSNGYLNLRESGFLALSTNATERARIDSSGNLLVGTTGASPFDSCRVGIATSTEGIRMRNTGSSGASSATMIRFLSNADATVGAITATGTATSYVTSSDYRLKHDIQPMTGALAKVAALKPVTYKWNADDSESQGFIAHELQEVVPECVTGEKDAVDADGNPQYQGIDTSFLVATLTAAIQEQQAIITALTARVEALEGAQA
jgi:hypothetical protein